MCGGHILCRYKFSYRTMASTVGVLTKFERAELVGRRVKALNSGEPTVLKPSEMPPDGDTHAIADTELRLRRMPLLLRRPLPGGGCEVVNPNKLRHLPFY